MSSVASAYAISLGGLQGVVVNVEAHLGPGLVNTRIVGSTDGALREAADRVRAAFISCGVPHLKQRLTVNLSPADIPKSGSSFDLAIAVAILQARGLLDPRVSWQTAFAAELSLDGQLQACRGAIAIAWAAKENGFAKLVVAPENLEEAASVPGISVFSCAHLRDLLVTFGPHTDGSWGVPGRPRAVRQRTSEAEPDLADVYGQEGPCRALLVAAVGKHNLLLYGEPGAGKSLLAHRLSSVLPDLSAEQAMMCAALRSLAGLSGRLTSSPPSESVNPHTSLAALLGGGSRDIRPGAISLAHNGVLVMDEAPEFSRRCLEALRQPLDDGAIITRRAKQTVTFPARFQLVMTANPCPCGGSDCLCRPHAQRLYRRRLSGPVLDRIDIHQKMSVPTNVQVSAAPSMSSAEARHLVTQARARSHERWPQRDSNSEATRDELRAALDRQFVEQIDHGVRRGWLSLRGADRVLRLCWSVADLEGNDRPTAEDFAYALDLRTREAWNG